MHLNIQSLRPKLDILEIDAQPYDVLVFTATWLSPSITDDQFYTHNFSHPISNPCDIVGITGDCVAVYEIVLLFYQAIIYI